MKGDCRTRDLCSSSLGHVQSVVERRNTIPILSNVLIEATADGAIKLTATDLDLQIVDCDLRPRWRRPARPRCRPTLLFDIARKLPEGSQVSIGVADQADGGDGRTRPASISPPCRATISR